MQKTTIYGLPMNPMPLLEQLKGASFCVSYATRAKLGKQLAQAIRLVGEDGVLLVDNGAFTHWGNGGLMTEDYIAGFEAWAEDILERCPQAIAVIPDVIRGTMEQNIALIESTGLDLDRAMPIWHMDEPLSFLRSLCDRFGYIGFGSTIDQPGSENWHARIKEAFAAIDAWALETGEPRPRVHIMRAQQFAHLYAFDTRATAPTSRRTTIASSTRRARPSPCLQLASTVRSRRRPARSPTTSSSTSSTSTRTTPTSWRSTS